MQMHVSKLLVLEKLPKTYLNPKINERLIAAGLSYRDVLQKKYYGSSSIDNSANYKSDEITLQRKNASNKYPKILLSQQSINKKQIIVSTALNRNYPLQHLMNYNLNGAVSIRSISTTNFNYQSAAGATKPAIEGDDVKQQTSENPEHSSVKKTEETNENSKSQSSDDTQASAADVEVDKSNELVLDFLPEKPLPVDGDSSSLLLGMDPPLESLGLASWWPSGRVQYFMEFLHSTSGLDLEWWQAIIVTTIIFRVIAFPMVVMAQKNVAHLNNHMPKMQQLQDKMSDARQRGDVYESAILGGELQTFMKEKKVNPMKNVIPMFLQFPLFASMFVGLRGMANLPLESMMSGGLFWFHDLTIPDPYYLLPFFTSASLYLQIHLGADGMSTQNFGPMGKAVMKAMPVALFLFTMNFPAAIGFYWCTTNVISVTQAKLIRIESLRKILGIPKFIKWDEKKLPVKQKGAREAFRETLDNWRVQNEVADRRTVDATAFRDAGARKPKKTFKHDPTKPKASLR